MTQQEFETRTGISYAHGEFDDMVNPIYMAAGQMDKDAFCAEFKKHSAYLLNSRIVSELVAEVETLRTTQQNYERQLKADAKGLQDFTYQMVDFLIIQAEKWSASDLREKAIKIVGIKEYIRRRMEMTLGLWEADRQALVEILK